MPPGPDVYGPYEAAEILGVQEVRFRVLARRDDFPEPRVLRRARIWDGAEIRAYALQRNGGRLEGRPVLQALRMHRDGHSFAEIGRELGAHPQTAARWLSHVLPG